MFDEFKNLSIWKVGNMYMAQPWAWSPLVLWYNTNKIKTPPTSINFLFDPALKQRIAFTRQQEDVIAWMGIASGAKKPYDMTKDELANAKEALKRLMPQHPQIPAAGGRARQADGGREHLGDGAQRRRRAAHQGCRRPGCARASCRRKDLSAISTATASSRAPRTGTPRIAWLQHRMQAKYIMENFLKYRRPLAYRGPARDAEEARASGSRP